MDLAASTSYVTLRLILNTGTYTHDPNRYSVYDSCSRFLMDLPGAANAGLALTKSTNAVATHMALEVVIPTATH